VKRETWRETAKLRNCEFFKYARKPWTENGHKSMANLPICNYSLFKILIHFSIYIYVAVLARTFIIQVGLQT
jgi:hypothetical protein